MILRWVTGLVLVVGVIGGAPGSALAGDGESKTVEITGWIVDDVCKRANANPTGKASTLTCHADGAKLVLFEEEEGAVYGLSDQEAAEAHAGYVKVTGTLDGDTLEVDTIEKLDHRHRGRGRPGASDAAR
jgi:hypothetical protein